MPSKQKTKRSFFKTTLPALVLSLVMVSGGVVGFQNYKERHSRYLSGANIVYSGGEVLGISSDEVGAVLDYGKYKNQGSNLIFGGVHNPKLENTKAWDLMASVGITSLRSDFFLDRFLPPNITLTDYRNNVNGIQDPAKWNQTEINKIHSKYQEARKRNMKTIGILSYSVKWLSYSNTNYGVPRDWDVYEDLVRKSYFLFRDEIDYLEIWNESDMDVFLDVKNSGLSKDDAYYQIVKHAVKAIREVDAAKNDGKKMKIGIGVVSHPNNIGMVQKILANPELSQQVNFISYHNYEFVPEPSYVQTKKVLTANKAQDMPIFLTEWAHTPNIKYSDPYVVSNPAISYAGSKLIDFLNMGLKGANYFSLQQIDPNSARGDEGYLGFYEYKNNLTTLLPISKTWMLMSKTLGLGAADSSIYQSTIDGNEKIAAWRNSTGQYGFVLSNSSDTATTYNITIQNFPISGDITASSFIANPIQDGMRELGSKVLSGKTTSMTMKVVAPANSVVGVKLNQAKLVDKIPGLN